MMVRWIAHGAALGSVSLAATHHNGLARTLALVIAITTSAWIERAAKDEGRAEGFDAARWAMRDETRNEGQ